MVITLDKNKRPLGYCTERRARILLERGDACVYRRYPFVLIIKQKDATEMDIHHRYRIKIDPGTQHTGIAVVEDDRVVLFMQIEHRGRTVHKNMQTRKAARRNRRSRETRYRKPGFQKGDYTSGREDGWLPPSVRSAPNNVLTWIKRLIRLLGPCDVSVEHVRFDTQLMEDPEISGKEYQHGTLYGFEIKEYLKEKYQNTCQYCRGSTEDHRLEWEHKQPRSREGSDRLDNATLSCRTCNDEKGSLNVKEWFEKLKAKKRKTELDMIRIECMDNMLQGKSNGQNLRYAAWMNATRWYLYEKIKEIQGVLSVELSTGGRTAYNRYLYGQKKDHHIDALYVGKEIPDRGYRGTNQKVLYITALGRGTRLRGNLNECGIIATKYRNRHKMIDGMQTGDIVHVTVPNGKYKGEYTGRVYVRTSGAHEVYPVEGKHFSATKKSVFQTIQHADGYFYRYE